MEECSDAVFLIELELQRLMRRLIETDPDAILRIEKIFHKVKVEEIVERHFR